VTGAMAVPMTGSEFAGWLAVTAGAAGGAAVAAYRQIVKRSSDPDGPKVREGRIDALIALTRSFEAFAGTVGAFIVHVQEQHGQHQREMDRQTAILDRLASTITRVEARQEIQGK